MSESRSPAEFMIQYVTRFKVRFEEEIENLVRFPLAQPAYQVIQLGRARRVLDAVDVLLRMGTTAIQDDQAEFERQRSILINTNLAYRRTQRELRSTPPRLPQVINQTQVNKGRERRR